MVFILLDDLGLGDITTYNKTNSAVTISNIDNLATTGMTFTNAHTSASVCVPTMYSIMTGKHALLRLGKSTNQANIFF